MKTAKCLICNKCGRVIEPHAGVIVYGGMDLIGEEATSAKEVIPVCLDDNHAYHAGCLIAKLVAVCEDVTAAELHSHKAGTFYTNE